LERDGQATTTATRRDVLGALVASTAYFRAPGTTLADGDRDLQVEVAKKAATLAAGITKPLRLLMPNGSGDNVRPVISAFAKATGVRIDAIEIPVDDINTKLTLDAMSGEGDYDLALPATFGLPDLVAAGSIIPLTQYAARHEPKDFRSGILYDIGDSFDGDIYGFQADGDTYVMFYNRDFLEDPREQERYADTYGVPLAIPTTWPELDRQMAFFHRPDHGRFGGSLFRVPGYLAWEWWVRFHAKGVWPLARDLTPQIASSAGIEALEEMIQATQYQAPDALGNGLFANWKRYEKGDIYANIGWGGTQKYLNGPTSKMRGRMAFGPTPGGFVDGELLTIPYFNWGWNYVVTSNSKRPELAYLFALFASTPGMSTVSVRQQGGYFDPFRTEHYKDPAIIDTYSPEFLKVHEASLRTSIPDLYLARQSGYFSALNDWIARALAGSITPKDALTRTARQWRLINKRSGQAQKARWLRLRDKYPSDVANRLRDLA
jgi:multiple sugar transport system substrate-binding protein